MTKNKQENRSPAKRRPGRPRKEKDAKKAVDPIPKVKARPGGRQRPSEEIKRQVAPLGKPSLPMFEKHQVLKILDSGHTKTHFHCALEGGITQHVPKRLFHV